MLKLSKAGKMPCRSWSLQAIDTCPGSRVLEGERKGELVEACSTCYATDGNYRFPNVKATRAHNRGDWERDGWVQDMVDELQNDRYFRWLDSGDLYSEALAWKVLLVMKLTPWVTHWLPTRTYKFAKHRKVLELMRELPNAVVRYSNDSNDGIDTLEGMGQRSVIVRDWSQVPAGAVRCSAPEQEGKCLKCRACWSKDVEVVAYLHH